MNMIWKQETEAQVTTEQGATRDSLGDPLYTTPLVLMSQGPKHNFNLRNSTVFPWKIRPNQKIRSSVIFQEDIPWA